MIKLESLYSKINFLENPVILKDKDDIIKKCINNTSGDFKTYLAIGTWSVKEIKKQLSKNVLNAIIKSFKKILNNDLTSKDKLVIISILPKISGLNYHLIEMIMPLIRFNGYTLIKEEYLEDRWFEEPVQCLTLVKKEYSPPLGLYKEKLWDYVISYQVDRNKNIMADVEFKIVGLMVNDNMRKLARQLVKKYPDLKYGKGDRPEIELKHVDFNNGEFRDTNAVSISILHNGEKYQLGWLSGRDEEIFPGTEIIPNCFMCDLLEKDEYKKGDDKIIEYYKLSSIGVFEKDGKKIYYGKILVGINTKNIGL